MEIEVGDYIRTKGDGLIRKVKGIEKYKHTFDTYYICEKTDTHYMEEDIKKHSKNIIDLIEVGDFVEMNAGTQFNSFYKIYSTEFLRDIKNYYNVGAKIKTILTHEQYEQNCFRLEENKK